MVKSLEVDPRLAEFLESGKQRKAIEVAARHTSITSAAKELGITRASYRNLITRAHVAAALRGYAPEHGLTKPVPAPFHVKGVSTLYDNQGNQRMQWVKSDLKYERFLEVVRETADELKTDVKRLKPIEFTSSRKAEKDLLNLYVLTDAHIGALAWHEDGGENWDLRIAEETINNAFDHLIANSPPAETAFFCQLGDGLHSDGLVPVTPSSGHVLDQDGRYPKVVRTAVRIFRRNITRLLEHHKKVVVLLATGNHDISGSVWLQEMFSAIYENNPRVEIIVSPLPYYAYKHGEVMLGFHHGHKSKPKDLPEVFGGEFRSMFGTTRQTYLHCGHLHERFVQEFNTAIVEQHATLAARDAYAAHAGYRSMRAMQCISYHKTRMERGRTVYVP